MFWILFLLVGGGVAYELTRSSGGSAIPPQDQIAQAVQIALAKETHAENLTSFAQNLMPVRPDLANQLNARAHTLSALTILPAQEASSAYVGPSQAQFARKLHA